MTMITEKLESAGLKFTRIEENIHIIHGQNRSRSPFSNSFLITGGPNYLLDAGCGIETIKRLTALVSIDFAILSHSHPDHTGGSWYLNSRGIDIIVPDDNADSIGNLKKLSERLVGNKLSKEWISNYLPATGYQDFTFSQTYSDGHEFVSGEINLSAIHTSGHTNDHYCFWEPQRKIVFGFDIDLSPFGPWYGNPESNLELFSTSISKIKNLPFETYISSHAKPMSRNHALKRLDAYESVIETRDRIILSMIPDENGLSLSDITRLSPIYSHDYESNADQVLFFGESNMISQHILRLTNKGLIHKDDLQRLTTRLKT